MINYGVAPASLINQTLQEKPAVLTGFVKTPHRFLPPGQSLRYPRLRITTTVFAPSRLCGKQFYVKKKEKSLTL